MAESSKKRSKMESQTLQLRLRKENDDTQTLKNAAVFPFIHYLSLFPALYFELNCTTHL